MQDPITRIVGPAMEMLGPVMVLIRPHHWQKDVLYILSSTLKVFILNIYMVRTGLLTISSYDSTYIASKKFYIVEIIFEKKNRMCDCKYPLKSSNKRVFYL